MIDRNTENTELQEVIDNPEKYKLDKFDIKNSSFINTLLHGMQMYRQMNDDNFIQYLYKHSNIVNFLNGYELEDGHVFLIYCNECFLGIYLASRDEDERIGDFIVQDEKLFNSLKDNIIDCYSSYLKSLEHNFYTLKDISLNLEEDTLTNYIKIYYKLDEFYRYEIKKSDLSFYAIGLVHVKNVQDIVNYNNCVSEEILTEINTLSDLRNKESIAKIQTILQDNNIFLLYSSDFKFYIVSQEDIV